MYFYVSLKRRFNNQTYADLFKMLSTTIKNICSVSTKVRTSCRFLSATAFKLSQATEVNPVENEPKLGKSPENPVIVPATTTRAIVGCRCTEFAQNINWFYLDAGDPQLCDCGFYFKLDKVSKDAPLSDVYRIMSVSDDVIKKCPRTRAKTELEKRRIASK